MDAEIKLRPLSIGSMELMQRLDCGFLTGELNLSAIVEYIYIHSAEISELEKMTPEEFQSAVLKFKYQLRPEDLQKFTDVINAETQKVEEAAFTVEDGKKKEAETRRTNFFKWSGRSRQKRATN